MTIPTDGRPTVDLMMPVWSPGFYGLQASAQMFERLPAEINYSEMLEWFGLQFARGGDPAREWMLEIRADATPAQKAHLASLLAHSRG
jgi:hypothetical protein